MGWTIKYRIRCRRQWSAADVVRLCAHEDEWSSRLSSLSEGYSVRGIVQTDDYHGFTKPAPSPRAASDYVNIVLALRELEQLFPEAQAFISDESGVNEGARPNAIDIEHLRQRMLEEWGDDGTYEDLPEDEDPSVELERAELALRRPARGRMMAREIGELLERAESDFEVWKRAQNRKKAN
jgi:hypothetical protein